MWLLLACFSVALATIETGCSISLKQDLGKTQPLILNENGTDFLAPTRGGVINLLHNQYMILACPGSFMEVDMGVYKQSYYNSTAVRVRCKSNKFLIFDQHVSMDKIKCSKAPTHVVNFTGEYCLGTRGKKIWVGFELPEGNDFRLYTTCFDEKFKDPFYTVFLMSKSICGHQVNYPREPYTGDGFYHMESSKVNELYMRNVQRATINGLIGLPADSRAYIKDTGSNYFTRGHLAAKVDFIFGSQQRLTFKFINSVPQWFALNKGNWFSLENDVRDLASANSAPLTVITGGHEVATMLHRRTSRPTKLYLYVNGTERAISVPKYIWKVVYDEESRAAVAFVANNNPYSTDLGPICINVCHIIKWINRNRNWNNVYCCEVNALRQIITTIPKFRVDSLLTIAT